MLRKTNMSSTPVFSNYETKNYNSDFHYSRAVRVGPWIKCAGQGCWDKEVVIPDNHYKQVTTAFESVEKAIKAAGGMAGKMLLQSEVIT